MESSENSICPLCGDGTIASVNRDFVVDIEEGRELRIPNIEMEVCDTCGEEILSLDMARKIDAAITDHRKRLSQEWAGRDHNSANDLRTGDGAASIPQG